MKNKKFGSANSVPPENIHIVTHVEWYSPDQRPGTGQRVYVFLRDVPGVKRAIFEQSTVGPILWLRNDMPIEFLPENVVCWTPEFEISY